MRDSHSQKYRMDAVVNDTLAIAKVFSKELFESIVVWFMNNMLHVCLYLVYCDSNYIKGLVIYDPPFPHKTTVMGELNWLTSLGWKDCHCLKDEHDKRLSLD